MNEQKHLENGLTFMEIPSTTEKGCIGIYREILIFSFSKRKNTNTKTKKHLKLLAPRGELSNPLI